MTAWLWSYLPQNPFLESYIAVRAEVSKHERCLEKAAYTQCASEAVWGSQKTEKPGKTQFLRLTAPSDLGIHYSAYLLSPLCRPRKLSRMGVLSIPKASLNWLTR